QIAAWRFADHRPDDRSQFRGTLRRAGTLLVENRTLADRDARFALLAGTLGLRLSRLRAGRRRGGGGVTVFRRGGRGDGGALADRALASRGAFTDPVGLGQRPRGEFFHLVVCRFGWGCLRLPAFGQRGDLFLLGPRILAGRLVAGRDILLQRGFDQLFRGG